MKKWTLFVATLTISFYSIGQWDARFGMKGGLNVSDFSSDADADFSATTSFHLGAFTMLKFSRFALQPELLYSGQNADVDFDQAVNNFDQDFAFLQIPILLKYYITERLNIHAGPQFALLLGADGTTLDDATPPNPRSLNKDDFKGTDTSVAIGIGYDLPLNLNVSARYLLGVKDISERDYEIKTRLFQLSVGIVLAENDKYRR